MLVHLHGHSHNSLLDAIGTEAQRAERAADLGQPALALTDHGNLSGAMHHRRACMDEKKGVGILAIHGVEAYFRERRQPHDKSNWDLFHCVLLVKNVTGWRNLKILTSNAFREDSFYRYPCIDLAALDDHAEGLICSTSCFRGWVPQAILQGDSTEALRRARELEKRFGDDLYFAIQPHDFDDQRLLNPALVNMAIDLSKPVVAESDEHYVLEEDADTQDIALMIRTKQTMAKRAKAREEEEDVFEFSAKTLFIHSEQEMCDLFAEYHPNLPPEVAQQAIDNTVEIANRCVPFVIDTKDKLPAYFEKVPGDVEDPVALLRQWTYDGLREKGLDQDPVYTQKADEELAIFEQKRLSEFFLITADMVAYALRHNIGVSPGRGSAAGSVVCYATGITFADPVTYGLLFERFLNVNRQGLPDIDIDFDPERVGEVKQYLMDKYGAEKVVDLCAFQTFASRKAIKDVGRVFDIDFAELNIVTKSIDDAMADEPLEEIRRAITEVDRFAEAHPDAWRHACKLQGQKAGMSEHPAGVVLSDRAVEEAGMPVMKKAKADDYMVTAWDQSADYEIVTKLGFLKIDMLSSWALTKQRYALDVIEKRDGERPNLADLPAMRDPFDVDDRVMENFRKGFTYGIWQFGASAGITNLLRQIQPTNILHLAACNALYRPGPLEQKDSYVARKNGTEEWEHWHPAVKSFLDSTYGLLVFQEQVQQIFSAIGGYSLTEADDVRRIISKEYRQKGDAASRSLAAFKERFVAHAHTVFGISLEFCEMIWHTVGGFAEYSFGLGHAVVFSLLSYQDMWVKTYYPDAFFSAQLSYPPKLAEKKATHIEKIIREARTVGIKILPPDINQSERGFTVTPEGIRFGLEWAKGIGPAAVKEIAQHQPFSSPDDVYERCSNKAVDKGTITALTESGAFDGFGVRAHMTEYERADLERERLGTALSLQDRVARLAPYLEERIHTEDEVQGMPHGSPVVVGGELIGGQEKQTRNGNAYARIEVAFGANTWRCTLWPKVWAESRGVLDRDEPVIIRGTWDAAWGTIVVDEVALVSDLYTPAEESPRIHAEAFA